MNSFCESSSPSKQSNQLLWSNENEYRWCWSFLALGAKKHSIYCWYVPLYAQNMCVVTRFMRRHLMANVLKQMNNLNQQRKKVFLFQKYFFVAIPDGHHQWIKANLIRCFSLLVNETLSSKLLNTFCSVFRGYFVLENYSRTIYHRISCHLLHACGNGYGMISIITKIWYEHHISWVLLLSIIIILSSF